MLFISCSGQNNKINPYLFLDGSESAQCIFMFSRGKYSVAIVNIAVVCTFLLLIRIYGTCTLKQSHTIIIGIK